MFQLISMLAPGKTDSFQPLDNQVFSVFQVLIHNLLFVQLSTALFGSPTTYPNPDILKIPLLFYIKKKINYPFPVLKKVFSVCWDCAQMCLLSRPIVFSRFVEEILNEQIGRISEFATLHQSVLLESDFECCIDANYFKESDRKSNIQT